MIHYHGVPLSGDTTTQVRALLGKHAMVSFSAPTSLPIVQEVCQSFCVDNGAFSAWRRGFQLDIEAYAEWVEGVSRHPCFDFYVIPDVIDGSHTENLRMIGKWRNLYKGNLLMHGAPVWHLHEPLEVLRDYVAAFRTVCIGSSGEFSKIGTGSWWQRMAQAMEVACDEDGAPKARLHGLRMLDPKIFGVFPFSSADSTNVARNIGIDKAWSGTYTPASKEARALIMMERIEKNGSAARWQKSTQHSLFC